MLLFISNEFLRGLARLHRKAPTPVSSWGECCIMLFSRSLNTVSQSIVALFTLYSCAMLNADPESNCLQIEPKYVIYKAYSISSKAEAREVAPSVYQRVLLL